MSKAWLFGDNVNTDLIIPARYNITIIESELAKNVFCEVKPDFSKNVKEGDVIVGGENFGCGSSREHAPIAIKGSKIKCIIAKSYARIFFRNAINIGLPILECPTLKNFEEGHDVEVNLETGEIINNSTGEKFQANPLPEFVLKIVNSGGIVKFLKEHEIDELE